MKLKGEKRESSDSYEESKGKMTFLLALVALISAFGSSFQYGYNVSVINSPAPYMQDFYNQTYFNRTGVPMDSGFQTLLWSLTVSMFPLGGLFGSLMVWPMVNNCGRKGTLLINNLFSIAAAILMGTSKLAKTFEVIILSRVIMGIYAGLASNVVPMFLGEISPKNLRGAIGVVPQLFITVGILVAQIFGLNSILGTAEGWPILLGLTGIPSLIQLLILPFFPESPRYLLIQKGNEEQARQALQKLRGWDDVDDEIEEMRQEDRSEKEEGQFSVLSLCTFRGLRWQLISIIVMMMGQQLSGVNGVFYYADRIFQSAGVDPNNVQYVTVSIGAINVVMTLLAAGLGPYSFLIFCAICLATIVYIFFIVPETKNKTFMEINRIMAKRNKVEIQDDKEELKDFHTVPGGQAGKKEFSSVDL
ncbi:solute carrier family facilitated glucose transporter member 5-like [Limosa lapponica baueri]|uniref:Solute carrier family 2, facilitated glucose transporter member 5 n=1 Tax=Limosa lapponica baueri TaxID=1758121 RepID=A0A2I0TQM1_LIMLA|nr:solute carrier family facilitated glucose transporter member 5-like [Limosa lapponica baueri]